MRALVLCLALLCSACTHVRVNSNTGSGNSISSSSAGVQVHASGTLAAVILAGMVLSAAAEESREPRAFPRLSSFSDWFWGRPPPPMEPQRPVSEQDCTKPIELDGNLRCR